jgi:hypothetical protein
MSRCSDASPREAEDARIRERPQPSERKRPAQPAVPEIGGPTGPEPTRFGDWEKGGRCTDF